ncbi:MAG TPA: helix-turn-helix domain-containing protein, partial [Blastocatellia bacterium]|nr:helix-turn-helix domain-containing protein [Blastocatellia bacterium]
HKVHKEYLRRKQAPAQPMPVQNEEVELAYECLEDCLQDLAIDNRDLILRYYYEDKRLKIDNRKELADRLGVAISALRTRVHRIRAALQKCVQRCIEQRAVQRC